MSLRVEDRVVRIWKFFAWAFEASVANSRLWFEKRILRGIGKLNTECLVLAHWLTCIYDYQVPADKVWGECFPIMAHVSKEFLEGVPVSQVLQKVAEGNKSLKYGDETFTHRFASKDKLLDKVKRTLKILENLELDLLEYMFKFVEGENWVRKVACHRLFVFGRLFCVVFECLVWG